MRKPLAQPAIFLLRLLVSSVFTLLAMQPQARAFEMSDVSVLFPLPIGSELPQTLFAGSSGPRGELIPASIRTQLPRLVARLEKDLTYSETVKVIAFRIDPCFAEGESPAPLACRRQIRLVWQPLIQKDDQVIAADAAVHTFYDLSENEWALFLSQYRVLVAKFPSPVKSPLSVNRNFLPGGFGSSYWQEVKTLLLSFCGEKTLSRLTLMSLDANENQWVFRGYDVIDANLSSQMLTPIQIPKIHSKGQTVALLQAESLDFRTTVFPFAQGDLGLWLYNDSKTIEEHYTEAQIRGFVRQQIAVENPMKHNPGTTDCASCHMAMATLDWARRNYSDWDWNFLVQESGYQSSSPLQASPGPIKTNRLRAFGYFNQTPIFSQRVVNETAQVLQTLESKK